MLLCINNIAISIKKEHNLQAIVPIGYFNLDLVSKQKISLLAKHVPGQLNAQVDKEYRTVKD